MVTRGTPRSRQRVLHTHTYVHRWAQQCAQLDTNTRERPHEPVLSQQSLAHSPRDIYALLLRPLQQIIQVIQ